LVVKPVAEKKVKQLPLKTTIGISAPCPFMVCACASAEKFSRKTDLNQLVMFVVRATKPFSSPAKIP
jgi:hypothetical protein